MKKVFLSILCLFMITGCGKEDTSKQNTDASKSIEQNENIKKEANKNSVYGIIDSAELYYTESLIAEKMSNINGKTNLIDKIEMPGKKPDSGVLYINNKGETALALVYDNVCYKKNFTEKNIIASEDISNCDITIVEPIKCKVTKGDGTKIGDEITCATESFYVYEITSDNIKMLSKYNIKVGGIWNDGVYTAYQENEITYLQDEDMKGYEKSTKERKGVTSFQIGSSNISYSGSIVKGYVDKYATVLRNMGVSVIDASLITKEEIEQLINEGNSLLHGSIKTKADAVNRPWIYSTSYWTGSSYDTTGCMWTVYKTGSFYSCSNCNVYNDFGVRPVITISKSDIEI